MSEKYKFRDPDGFYFVTCTVVDWIDLFTRKELKHVVLDRLRYYQTKRSLSIHAYCLMPSHLHMIVSSEESLGSILRDFKRTTNQKIISSFNLYNESRRNWLMKHFKDAASKIKRVKGYKIWRDGTHPIRLDTNKMIEQRLNYIHHNPVEAEIVDEPHFYWYSSARNYMGNQGLLEVQVLC